jgi:hypothetical protein
MSAPGAAVAEYEALRREVGAADGPRGLGLALVLARGLPAWLAALTALGPSRAAPPSLGPGGLPAPPVVGPASRRALTTILAGMVLACTRSPEGVACPTAR